jgi:hypothetical protein
METRTIDAIITKSMQEIEDRISGMEDTIEETNKLAKKMSNI